MNKKIIRLTKSECYHTLKDFYETVISHLDITNKEDLIYDSRKICVTKTIQASIIECYLEQGLTKEEINTVLLMYGPKANLEGTDFIVEIEEGFIVGGEE